MSGRRIGRGSAVPALRIVWTLPASHWDRPSRRMRAERNPSWMGFAERVPAKSRSDQAAPVVGTTSSSRAAHAPMRIDACSSNERVQVAPRDQSVSVARKRQKTDGPTPLVDSVRAARSVLGSSATPGRAPIVVRHAELPRDTCGSAARHGLSPCLSRRIVERSTRRSVCRGELAVHCWWGWS